MFVTNKQFLKIVTKSFLKILHSCEILLLGVSVTDSSLFSAAECSGIIFLSLSAGLCVYLSNLVEDFQKCITEQSSRADLLFWIQIDSKWPPRQSKLSRHKNGDDSFDFTDIELTCGSR